MGLVGHRVIVPLWVFRGSKHFLVGISWVKSIFLVGISLVKGFFLVVISWVKNIFLVGMSWVQKFFSWVQNLQYSRPSFLIFFFVIVNVIIDITQKAFVIPCFKRSQKLDLLRCIKKVSNLLAKMVTYSKKFCGSVMIIGHYYNVIHLFEASHEECDITEFNQLDL